MSNKNGVVDIQVSYMRASSSLKGICKGEKVERNMPITGLDVDGRYKRQYRFDKIKRVRYKMMDYLEYYCDIDSNFDFSYRLIKKVDPLIFEVAIVKYAVDNFIITGEFVKDFLEPVFGYDVQNDD